ncbi:alpha/beta-hydrolase [Cutaneotrichosporon oleaginosum]|uniref:Alpha/beta-hydrolase n=1 Tax=Cutaneotrichosporon oleaginosum TaxID=879819 RepID=A0A0J0XMA5_9TREE|nr:alpha/beta-hydrolase [Cutaneotrichosporon oleaginosum]KLT42256.1 alpha/beta-hydrolase [Cutaneotrichosporon oleaginosum]TXT11428.1 hypothetical protein COLE_01838 [Cutaneotrichosporon oleaginosum]
MNTSVNVTGFSSNSIDHFLGIPYAESPTGLRRFKQPEPKVYNATLNGTDFPPACLQPNFAPWNASGISEDCLTLSVLAPTGAAGSNWSLPVMVFIHGGNFTQGAASTYASPQFVSYGASTGRPFVLVTLNYRLGVLGFAAGPDVARTSSANLGLRDQRLALRWVQDNIMSFGGDPAKVVAFGQGAGAVSIGLHLLNATQDLFRGAILQSGAPSSALIWNVTETREAYNTFAAAAGCKAPNATNLGSRSTWECLSRSPAGRLQDAAAAGATTKGVLPSAWAPSIDGDVVRQSPYVSLENGTFSRVPVITGNCKDEGTLFTDPTTPDNTTLRTVMDALVRAAVDDTLVNATEAAYPNIPRIGSPFDTGNETFGLSPKFKQLAAVTGDLLVQSRRRHHLSQATVNNVSMWSYEWWGRMPAPAYVGIPHTAELEYVFGRATSNYTAQEQAAGRGIMNYWLNFAYYLDPNGPPQQSTKRNNDGASESASGVGDTGWTDGAWWPQYGGEHNTLIMEPGNFRIAPDTYREDQMRVFEGETAARALHY